MPDITHRLYIDESGDHTYRFLDDERRFLGITGVLFRRDVYDPAVPSALEQLKRRHLTYDVDDPPILVRSQIVRRLGAFWRLRDNRARTAWADDLLEFFRTLECDVFTVVIDKRAHYERHGDASTDPYLYAARALLSRVTLRLTEMRASAGVMAESRGAQEDQVLEQSYQSMREEGEGDLTATQLQAALPSTSLITRKKEFNVAGLQLADLLAYGLKKDILERNRLSLGALGPFTRELNATIAPRIGTHGRCLLI